MDTNDEVRRRRLERLCRETPGGLTGVAERAGVSRASLDQILKRVLLPAGKNGTQNPRSLGDLAARKIESAHGLPPGWLDWPFDAVTYESYAILTDLDRGAVQARLMAAIEDRLQSPVYGGAISDRDGKAPTKVVYSEPRIDLAPKKHRERLGLEEFQVTGKGLTDEANKARRVSKSRGSKRA